jgi:hypothetical protein
MNELNYTDQGFIILSGIIDNNEIEQVFIALDKLLQTQVEEIDLPKMYEEGDLENKLIFLKANHPAKFGSFYDRCQCLVELQKISLNQRLLETASQLMDIPEEVISVSSQAIRIDTPHDTNHTLGWHQESSYSFFNKKGENGLVCWIPLQDTDISKGTIQVAPKSFCNGWVAPESIRSSADSSETRCVPQDMISKYENKSVEVKKGDAVFLNMDLFHRSGSNISKNVRFTCRARFHNTTAKDFVPHRMNAVPSKKDLNNIFSNDSRLSLLDS